MYITFIDHYSLSRKTPPYF